MICYLCVLRHQETNAQHERSSLVNLELHKFYNLVDRLYRTINPNSSQLNCSSTSIKL